MGLRRPFQSRILALVFLAGLVAPVVSANPPAPGVYGYEFTFSPDDRELRRSMKGLHPPEIWKALAKSYLELCGELGCEFDIPGHGDERIERKGFQLTFADGFWVKLVPDPSVVEMTMPKMTAAELDARSAFLETHFFARLREKFAMRPLRALGGGHVNVDVASHFGTDAELLLDFLEDSFRHQDMFRHVSREPSNAIREMSEGRYLKVREILLEARRRSRAAGPRALPEIVRFLGERFDSDDVQLPKNVAIALHFDGPPESWRIEFRTPKPPQSVEEARRFADLLAARVAHLRRNPPPVPGLPPYGERLRIGSLAEAETAFVHYVEGMGERLPRYLAFLRAEIAESLGAKYCAKTLR